MNKYTMYHVWVHDFGNLASQIVLTTEDERAALELEDRLECILHPYNKNLKVTIETFEEEEISE